MGYEPLHHKYRPQTFAQLVGQGAIATTLSSALSQQRIAPAYLFSGPRGTGKTSSARILAKSLNCISGDTPTAEPCGTCEICTSITDGSSLDVIEIDAASNTGVDNIRELIERAQFAPVQCRYKVYVVDECHMLSAAAFNALLKTLEEPPDRVVFVLATTDPQRVLPTIISRCQRFDFRRIALPDMIAHLGTIARQESINIADEALQLVAQVSQGGLRDAESLLDQLSLIDGQIVIEKVWDLVGAVPERDLLALVKAIASDNGIAVLDCARHLMDRGREPLIVLQNLAGFYRDLLIAKTAGDRQDLVAITLPTWKELCEFVQTIDIATILLGQQHLRESEIQVKNTTQPRLWLEVTLMGLLPSALHPVQPNTFSIPTPGAGAIAPLPVSPVTPPLATPPPAPSLPAPSPITPTPPSSAPPIPNSPAPTTPVSNGSNFSAPATTAPTGSMSPMAGPTDSGAIAPTAAPSPMPTPQESPPSIQPTSPSPPPSAPRSNPPQPTTANAPGVPTPAAFTPAASPPPASPSPLPPPSPNPVSVPSPPIFPAAEAPANYPASAPVELPKPSVPPVPTYTKEQLDQLWQQITALVKPPIAQTLFQQQGRLIGFNGNVANVAIKSKQLMRLAEQRIEKLSTAFEQVLNRPVRVTMEVATLAAATAAPPPSSPAPSIAQPPIQHPAPPSTPPSTSFSAPSPAPPPITYSPPPSPVNPAPAPIAPVPPTVSSPVPPPPVPPPPPIGEPTLPPIQNEDAETQSVKRFANMFNGEIVELDPQDLDLLPPIQNTAPGQAPQNGAHTNSAHTNSAHTNSAHTNGASQPQPNPPQPNSRTSAPTANPSQGGGDISPMENRPYDPEVPF